MDAAQASKVSFNGLSLCCSGIMSFGTHPVVFQEGCVRFKVVNLFAESLQMFLFNPVLIVALLCIARGATVFCSLCVKAIIEK